MKTILLAIALLLPFTAFAGTQYYLDPSCTHNGNGLASTCAASPGASGAYNTGFTFSGTGSDLSIKAGTTLANSRIRITATGTSDDHVTITRYGEGADPILDGAATQTDSWTNDGGAIYYATNASSAQIKVLTVNGTRYKAIPFTTNAATTKALMSAGTYFTDTGASRLYLWMADGSNPAGDLIEYSANTTAFFALMDTYFNGVQYVDVSNISFKRSQIHNLYLGLGTGYCDNCSISNVTSTMSGDRGLFIAGNNAVITNNTCSDNSSELNSTDAACIVIEAPTSRKTYGGEVAYNTVSNTRFGSCYEINGTAAGSSIENIHFHDNIGTECRHGVELWGCNSANCTGNNYNIVENNFFSGRSTIGTGGGQCIGTGATANYNIIRNNICVDFYNSGLGTRTFPDAAGGGTGRKNKFYNNTLYFSAAPSESYAGAFTRYNRPDSRGENEFRNNIAYLASGGQCIYTGSGSTSDIFDNNICYSASGNYAIYNGNTYATLAAYQVAYTAATGRVDSSVNQDPTVNWTDYTLLGGSPALAFGDATLGVGQDKNGKVRSAVNDAGAIQTSDDNSTLNIGASF
jgi:hypothetical protein